MNPEEIKKDAQKIMDNFMGEMKDIQIEENFVLEREKCFREEGNGTAPDEDFKQRFLSNAKRTSGDAILANKGDWV
ncbi:MAG: hypothetical protein HRU03_02125 [Nanoarchaeales archaeon]|nr:hypothetical protein [Nanoarchaeales archaeon]